MTKFLPLTIIAIFSNLSPMITVVMAYMILKEKLKCFEMIIMILSLGAVITYAIFPASNEDKN